MLFSSHFLVVRGFWRKLIRVVALGGSRLESLEKIQNKQVDMYFLNQSFLDWGISGHSKQSGDVITAINML